MEPETTASLDSPETVALGRDAVEAGQRQLRVVADKFESTTQRRLGHYRLGPRLGAGGMGMVFEAYDEKLARKVALKLMRRAKREADQRRFVREAQAMARLSHPNVVQVHEIGEAEGMVFIVMEIVEGVTLASWLRDGPRSLAEILAVFDAAGRGLVAAHEAGLVHRDFKPANVLVGRDGRVLVTDFGLARASGLASEPGGDAISGDGEEPPSFVGLDEVTRAGTVVGTPAYMAPEQFLGREAGPACDQFGFCVAVWEACFGARPFAGRDFDELALEVTNGRIRGEPGKGPGWLRRTLERGLHVDPERRWPSIAALLDHLRQRSRRRTRRRWIAGATVGVALIGAGLGFGVETRSEAQARAECAEQAAALAEVWNPEVAAEFDALLLAAPLAYARTSWPRARVWMDAYAAEWAEVAEHSCIAARVDGRYDAARWERIEACLDQRRTGFAALVELGSEGDPEVIGYLGSAVANLVSPATCIRDLARLDPSPPPRDLAAMVAIREIRDRIERAKALREVGRYEAGLELARAAEDDARALGWAPLRAEAGFEVGKQLEDLARYPEARDAIVAAFLDASESGHELVALEAAGALGFIIGNRLVDPERGLVWVELANRLVVRDGLSGTVHAADAYNALSLVHYQFRHFDVAEQHARRAHALYVEVFGADHPTVGVALGHIAIARSSQGDPEGALEYLDRAVDNNKQAYGPVHPEVARVLNNYAVILMNLGRWDQAIVAYEEVLGIWDAAFEHEHVSKSSGYYGLGRAYEGKGELDRALTYYERARALQSEVNAEDPNLHYPLDGIGRVASLLGDHPRAVEALERDLELRTRGGADADTLASPRFALAEALAHTGELERARALALAAREAYAAREPSPSERLAEIDAWLAANR